MGRGALRYQLEPPELDRKLPARWFVHRAMQCQARSLIDRQMLVVGSYEPGLRLGHASHEAACACQFSHSPRWCWGASSFENCAGLYMFQSASPVAASCADPPSTATPPQKPKKRWVNVRPRHQPVSTRRLNLITWLSPKPVVVVGDIGPASLRISATGLSHGSAANRVGPERSSPNLVPVPRSVSSNPLPSKRMPAAGCLAAQRCVYSPHKRIGESSVSRRCWLKTYGASIDLPRTSHKPSNACGLSRSRAVS